MPTTPSRAAAVPSGLRPAYFAEGWLHLEDVVRHQFVESVPGLAQSLWWLVGEQLRNRAGQRIAQAARKRGLPWLHYQLSRVEPSAAKIALAFKRAWPKLIQESSVRVVVASTRVILSLQKERDYTAWEHWRQLTTGDELAEPGGKRPELECKQHELGLASQTLPPSPQTLPLRQRLAEMLSRRGASPEELRARLQLSRDLIDRFPFISATTAAEFLDVTRQRVHYLHRKGRLGVMIDGALYLSVEELVAYSVARKNGRPRGS